MVMWKFDDCQVDHPGQPVRIRLNSMVVHVAPNGGGPVAIAYMNGDKLRSVSARGCVLAGYNMMIPYIVPTLPEKQKAALHELEIGRASCRERGCQYV